ncbi:hypothetical protein F4824DRAFT_447216 [Ustulina deusta]|nr:hypothetical protein F4824DRAFT_447216 [Ustulina deusta]
MSVLRSLLIFKASLCECRVCFKGILCPVTLPRVLVLSGEHMARIYYIKFETTIPGPFRYQRVDEALIVLCPLSAIISKHR